VWQQSQQTVCNGEGQKPVSQRNVSEILQGKHSKDMKGQFICINKLCVTDYVLMSNGDLHNQMTFKTGFEIMCITRHWFRTERRGDTYTLTK
jgi:hypothetical protein